MAHNATWIRLPVMMAALALLWSTTGHAAPGLDDEAQRMAQAQPQPPPGGYAPARPLQPQPVYIVEQPMPSYKNRLSFGPLGLLFGFGNFTYERGLSERFGIEISPSFMYWGFSEDKLYGGGLGLAGAVYISGDAPRGLRFSVGAEPGFVTIDFRNSTGSTQADETVFLFRAKALFGYNWVWRSQFTLGLAGGVQYVHLDHDSFKGAIKGVLPALDFNLGFVW